jgi:hypothetical protein
VAALYGLGSVRPLASSKTESALTYMRNACRGMVWHRTRRALRATITYDAWCIAYRVAATSMYVANVEKGLAASGGGRERYAARRHSYLCRPIALVRSLAHV